MKNEESSITSRSIYGSVVLIIRQILVQFLNFLGSIFLARFLSVSDYGFYGVLFFLLSFIINFGDIGLAVSLIRQKSTPTYDEEKTIFTIQCILSILIFIILIIIGPQLCKIYKLPNNYKIYFNLLSLTILILVFKTIPTVKLERNLQFGWLSVIEIIQAAFYNGTAVLLAYLNYGPLSFCIALVIRTLIGSILVNFIRPFKFGFNFNLKILKNHLKFGIPYQLNVYVNLAKDSISPVIIGAVLGIAQTGTVNMASTIAAFPVLFLSILSRLFLPAFSRTRDKENELNFLFKMSLRICNAFTAATGVFVLVMNESFIRYVVGSKWLIINPLFFFLWSANLTIPTMFVCTSLLNALGYPKIVLKHSLLWAFLTLGIGGGLIFFMGIYGFGISNVAVNISMFLLFREVKKYINCSIFKEFLTGWIPAVFPAVFLYMFSNYFSANSIRLFSGMVAYMTVYVLIFTLLSYKDLMIFFPNLFTKNIPNYNSISNKILNKTNN